jgi:hypothetical protein
MPWVPAFAGMTKLRQKKKAGEAGLFSVELGSIT